MATLHAQKLRSHLRALADRRAAFLPPFTLEAVALADLVTDAIVEQDSPEPISVAKITEYAKMVQAGSEIPPITAEEVVFFSGKVIFIVVDGRHRTGAALGLGHEMIWAVVVRTLTLTPNEASALGDVGALITEVHQEYQKFQEKTDL